MISKRIRILIHTQYFPPENGAPQSRLSDLAHGLSLLGFEVTVLTALPNYPTGEIFPTYRKPFIKENSEGYKVYRVLLFPTQKTSFIPRLFSYFSFVFSSFIVGLFLPKNDFIITESPPLFLGISGFSLSKIKGSKWIFNVADLWPESVVELGLVSRNSFSYKFSSRMESFFYHKASVVTGQSNTIIKNIVDRFPEVKTYHLSNGVNPDNYLIHKDEIKERISIIYAGLHGIAQGLDLIVDAATSFREYPKIDFIFIGDGPDKRNLQNYAEKLCLSNVKFLSAVSKSKIPSILATADIILVPLRIQLTGAVPSKLYEGMATGKPVILIAESEAAEIINNYDCGIVVKPGDVNSLVKAIQFLIDNPAERTRLGLNGRKAVLDNFNRKKIVQNFANFLELSLNDNSQKLVDL